MNPYYYLYYVVYSLLEAINGLLKNTIIQWSSMFLVTVLVGLNVFTIMAIIEIENNIPILKNSIIGKVIMALLLLVNYFIFIYKQRYKIIIKEYSKKKPSGGGYLLIYLVITIWLFFHYINELRELNLSGKVMVPLSPK